MVPALTAAGLNAHWAALYAEMTHGMNTGRVAFEGGKVRTGEGHYRGGRGAAEADRAQGVSAANPRRDG
jgi:hypothetical protein